MSHIPNRTCCRRTRIAFTSVWICGALISVVSGRAYGQSPDSLEQSIAGAGRTGLHSFLDKIPQGKEEMYGFRSRTEFVRASVGVPYRVYTIADSQLNDGNSLSDALHPLEEWRLPVTVDGQFRAMLTVSRTDGRWRAVDFGAAGLAKELGAFERQNASLLPMQRKGIVRLFSLHCDFVTLTRQSGIPEDFIFWPLTSARSALQATGIVVNERCSLRELLPLLQAGYAIQQGSSH